MQLLLWSHLSLERARPSPSLFGLSDSSQDHDGKFSVWIRGTLRIFTIILDTTSKMASTVDFYNFLAAIKNKNVKYLLFDCDNTLVESEDISSEVCSELINDILEKENVATRFPPVDLIYHFPGLSFRRVLTIIQHNFEFQLSEDEIKKYVKIQGVRVIANIRSKCQPCPGVTEALTELCKIDGLTLAVVSSSSLHRIHACLETAGLDKFFDNTKIFSASDSLTIPSSKPNPAVYIHALEKLGAKPEQCLTVEDSMSGTRSAVGANLKCLGYIGSLHTVGMRTEMARQLLNAGCIEIMWHYGNYGRHLHTAEAEEKERRERASLLEVANNSAK